MSHSPPPPPARRRFGKEKRVRLQRDFRRVYAAKHYAADDTLVINGCENQLPTGSTRLGLSVSRAVGNATIRNRWKRWIREAFRLAYGELPCGFDFVVRPKRGANGGFAAIRSSLPRLTQRVARRIRKAAP
ncbi:MAG: ribonuclease P protein component [Planctomycetes bacterium]|nr:ribonuclease P protein component [Planctomycetota bacterium]